MAAALSLLAALLRREQIGVKRFAIVGRRSDGAGRIQGRSTTGDADDQKSDATRGDADGRYRGRTRPATRLVVPRPLCLPPARRAESPPAGPHRLGVLRFAGQVLFEVAHLISRTTLLFGNLGQVVEQIRVLG